MTRWASFSRDIAGPLTATDNSANKSKSDSQYCWQNDIFVIFYNISWILEEIYCQCETFRTKFVLPLRDFAYIDPISDEFAGCHQGWNLHQEEALWDDIGRRSGGPRHERTEDVVGKPSCKYTSGTQDDHNSRGIRQNERSIRYVILRYRNLYSDIHLLTDNPSLAKPSGGSKKLDDDLDDLLGANLPPMPPQAELNVLYDRLMVRSSNILLRFLRKSSDWATALLAKPAKCPMNTNGPWFVSTEKSR